MDSPQSTDSIQSTDDETGVEALIALAKDTTVIELDDSTGIHQEIIDFVGSHFTMLESLSIISENEDSGVNASFLTFDHRLSFPHLKMLEVNASLSASICLDQTNAPRLERLCLENVQLLDLDLNLPKLKSFFGQLTDIGYCAKQFAPSLSRCRNLESVNFYKLWGLSSSRTHKLYLPSCQFFDLHRSDDLKSMDLYAPLLKIINFKACYALKHVKLVDEPFLLTQYRCFVCKLRIRKQRNGNLVFLPCMDCGLKLYCSERCKSAEGESRHSCRKSIDINVLDVVISNASLDHLVNHPRVGDIQMPIDKDDL